MANYAKSKDVYRQIRAVFQPYAVAHGFSRVKKSDASWVKRIPGAQNLEITFGINYWGREDHGGHLHLQIALQSDPPKLLLLHEFLDREGLERKAAVERIVEARWPFKGADTQERDVQFRSHIFGEQVLKVSRGFTTSDHSFSYYGLADVKDWMEFIVGELPRIIEQIESRYSS